MGVGGLFPISVSPFMTEGRRWCGARETRKENKVSHYGTTRNTKRTKTLKLENDRFVKKMSEGIHGKTLHNTTGNFSLLSNDHSNVTFDVAE